MADSRKETKVVEYVLQGNTVDLEKALTEAVATVDALDQKLTAISTSARMLGGQDKTSFKRAAAISAAETQAEKLREALDIDTKKFALLSPDQLNLINQANKELQSILDTLNKAKSNTTVTQKTIDKSLTRLRAVNKAIREANIKLNETAKKSKSINEVWGKITAIIAAVRIATSYFEKLYGAAANFVETINLFNVAVKGTKDEMVAFAERMADAYNTDIKPIYNSIAVFRQYANTLGFATKAANTFSEGLTKLNYDLASLYNVEYEEMATALKSGLAGQTKALMKYGISVHSATVQQTALNLGIEKSMSEWTAAEKVALRYLSILEQTTNAHGDLARTIESPVNQFKILKAQLQILLRNLGSLVVLVAKNLLPLINGLLIAFNKFFEMIAKAAGYEIEDYSDNLSPTNEMLGEITDEAEEAEDAMKHLLAPLDEINQITPKETNLGLQGGIDPEIEAALRSYDNLMDQIDTKTDKLAEAFQGLFDLFAARGLGESLKGVFDVLKTAIDIVAQALVNLEPVLTPILTVVSALLQSLGWLLSNVANPVLKFIGALTGQSGALLAAVLLLNAAYAVLTGDFKKLIAVKIIQWFATLSKKMWENISATVKLIANLVKERYEMIKNAIETRLAAGAKWQLAIAAIAAAGAAALVVAGIVAAGVALASGTAATASSQDFTPGGAAKGGVTTGPTLSWIGEGKYNEAVIPLERSPQFASMKEDIAASVYEKISRTPTYQFGQPRRGDSATVILNVNGKELARALLPDLGITRPQTGVKLT